VDDAPASVLASAFEHGADRSFGIPLALELWQDHPADLGETCVLVVLVRPQRDRARDDFGCSRVGHDH
jgi:hypothetical protein